VRELHGWQDLSLLYIGMVGDHAELL
jgi:hypothetical protein